MKAKFYYPGRNFEPNGAYKFLSQLKEEKIQKKNKDKKNECYLPGEVRPGTVFSHVDLPPSE